MDELARHMAEVCIDLRCLWGKLHVLEWVLGNARHIATGHHVTAGIANVEGVRCGQGLPQTEFFAKPLPSPDAEDEPDPPDDEGVVADHEEDEARPGEGA